MANKPVIFDPMTGRDIRSAKLWYRKQSADAPKLFSAQLDLAIARMIERPETFPDLTDGTKRVLLDRFPYMLVFKEYPHHLYVYAVADCRRRHFHWKKRLR